MARLRERGRSRGERIQDHDSILAVMLPHVELHVRVKGEMGQGTESENLELEPFTVWGRNSGLKVLCRTA